MVIKAPRDSSVGATARSFGELPPMTRRIKLKVEDKETMPRCLHPKRKRATYSVMYIDAMSRFSFLWRALVFSASIAVSCRGFVVSNRPPSSQHAFRDSRLWHAHGGQETVLDSPAVNKTSKLRTLYPPLEAHRNGTLKVDKVHILFYQEYGQDSMNENALTALFLHGGPGAGCFPNHARFFDPDKYRIVLLDQRGCGQSTPRGEVQGNTLHHLVYDCELIRKELGIQVWDVILGGSWGTTLAIAYAQTYPERVRSIVLRGVCLMRPGEIDWLFSSKGGAATLDPIGWANFSKSVGINDDDSVNGRAALHGHYDRLLCSDPVARLNAARSWMMWEMRVSSLARRGNQTETPSPVLVWERERGLSFRDAEGNFLQSVTRHETHVLRRGISTSNDQVEKILTVRPLSHIVSKTLQPPKTRQEAAKFVPAQAMLTCFYSVNERFVTSNVNLLAKERIDRLRHIPCIVVQGGIDTICPPDTALDLHEAWPEVELRIPTASGHSMYDPAITNDLVRATDRFADMLLEAVDI